MYTISVHSFVLSQPLFSSVPFLNSSLLLLFTLLSRSLNSVLETTACFQAALHPIYSVYPCVRKKQHLSNCLSTTPHRRIRVNFIFQLARPPPLLISTRPTYFLSTICHRQVSLSLTFSLLLLPVIRLCMASMICVSLLHPHLAALLHIITSLPLCFFLPWVLIL